jgi:hypothetical protein
MNIFYLEKDSTLWLKFDGDKKNNFKQLIKENTDDCPLRIL